MRPKGQVIGFEGIVEVTCHDGFDQFHTEVTEESGKCRVHRLATALQRQIVVIDDLLTVQERINGIEVFPVLFDCEIAMAGEKRGIIGIGFHRTIVNGHLPHVGDD